MAKSAASIRPLYIWLGAIGLILFELFQAYANHLIQQYDFPFSWWTISIKHTTRYFCWVLLASVIQRLAVRYGAIFEQRQFQMSFQIVALSAMTILLHVILANLLIDTVYFFQTGVWVSWFHLNKQGVLIGNLFASFNQYIIFTAVFWGVNYYQQYLKKQQELSQARLDALLMQLHPHFLFNTLHSVSSLIDIEPKAAQKMLTRLGNLLRKVLMSEGQPSSSLEEELDFIKDYLAIEKVRFQDRMDVVYQIDEQSLKAKVPSLILQPLVENAIKYGLSNKRQGGIITISSSVQYEPKSQLHLEVYNNGKGNLKQTSNSQHGIGLKNVENRLALFYSNQYKLEINASSKEGFTVHITVPFEAIKSETNEH